MYEIRNKYNDCVAVFNQFDEAVDYVDRMAELGDEFACYQDDKCVYRCF